jgi:hypothetical protein
MSDNDPIPDDGPIPDKGPIIPKKRPPSPEEHIRFYLGSMDPDGNVEQATDELARAAWRDPRIQEALDLLREFFATPIGASNRERAHSLDGLEDFESFHSEFAPLFAVGHLRAADMLTSGRGYQRFKRSLGNGQMLLDQVRATLNETDALFLEEVLAEAVRRAKRSRAFLRKLGEAAHQANWLIQHKLPELRFGERFDAALHEQSTTGEDTAVAGSSAAIAGLAVFGVLIITSTP